MEKLCLVLRKKKFICVWIGVPLFSSLQHRVITLYTFSHRISISSNNTNNGQQQQHQPQQQHKYQIPIYSLTPLTPAKMEQRQFQIIFQFLSLLLFLVLIFFFLLFLLTFCLTLCQQLLFF